MTLIRTWEPSHSVCSLTFTLDKTLSDQICLFTGVHILMTVWGDVECQKGSSAMVANRSDNWDDEDAEDDGNMSDLVR